MKNDPMFEYINSALNEWVMAQIFWKSMLYERYKAHRLKYNMRAEQAYRWAKQKPQAQYINELPRFRDGDDATFVTIPGLGDLKFELKSDDEHNPFDYDGQAFEWHPHDGGKHQYNVGTCVGYNTYSLDHWDRNEVYVVHFDKKDRLEDRRAYHHAQGMSKSDAEVCARASIKNECKYWSRVVKGEVVWVGACVSLFAYKVEAEEAIGDGWVELDKEEVWGFELDDSDYLLNEMNSWAVSLVMKHWELMYECDVPLPGNKIVDEAWKAWHTAMITSDYDRSIADPVFVSTYKEKLNV